MSGAAGTDAGFSVVWLLGEADAYTAPRVQDDLAAALGTEATGLESLLPIVRSWEDAASKTRTV